MSYTLHHIHIHQTASFSFLFFLSFLSFLRRGVTQVIRLDITPCPWPVPVHAPLPSWQVSWHANTIFPGQRVSSPIQFHSIDSIERSQRGWGLGQPRCRHTSVIPNPYHIQSPIPIYPRSKHTNTSDALPLQTQTLIHSTAAKTCGATQHT